MFKFNILFFGLKYPLYLFLRFLYLIKIDCHEIYSSASKWYFSYS